MQTQRSPHSIVVDTTRSPYARLKPVPVKAVHLRDDFWGPRLMTLRETTLPSQRRQMEETGRIDNFRRAGGQVATEFQGYLFNDSDVYKWVEAVSWALASAPDAALERMLGEVIAAIEGAQDEDGYLNSYFTSERATERWTNLKDWHELYCAGHLLQAAIAHHRSTGGDPLLKVAVRFADHICDVFGPEEAGKRPGTGGHPEIEMALVELARETGDRRYLEQAAFFLEVRGRGLIGGQVYHQDHMPFRELARLAGHAVRAIYLCAGAADLFAESGDRTLLEALERLWGYMSRRQSYISGGIGSQQRGEAFGEDYDLPNRRAYAETCAAIASVMWNWRMLHLGGEGKYADALETALYNAVLVGIGLDGESYCYHNPLANEGDFRRQPWFRCACCPPNLARMLASLPGYFYSVSEEGVWVHLYAEGEARIQLPTGVVVQLEQRTRYPWEGEVEFEIRGAGHFTLFLRIPGWAAGSFSVEVNAQAGIGDITSGGYLQIDREWEDGDVVRIALAMPARRVVSHPYVCENVGQVAIMRGPLLYCLEEVDHPGLDLRDLHLPDEARVSVHPHPELLGGIVRLEAEGHVRPPGERWEGRLYHDLGRIREGASERPVQLTAIPYYAWANREPGQMQVWVKRLTQGINLEP